MDSYDFVDSVKAEKANALARYKRFTNIAKFFQLIEVFVAVALLSWSSTHEKAIVKTESEVTAVTAIKQAAKQIERFQRTQSDKIKIQNSVKPRRELRRSVTEKSRKSIAATSGDEESTVTSFDAVDRLSNEEFRIAVEAFISKQQSILKQQSMAVEF
ncbi:hypothetical protein L2E82_26962 [Cichorium intybus]|uniref:Uncharacterized protein n=1 Tax=Cichorium intybus TaxID=13427 RepID=A0ACB9CRX6_CICIN|nr:hypothetical protein L2E82_26962 [Cichorium intybus]